MAKKVLPEYKARDIMAKNHQELWSMGGNGRIMLICDDGEIETTVRRAIYCSYLWDIHRHFPKTPLLTTHTMGMERLSSKIHLNLLSAIYKNCVYAYADESNFDREHAWKVIYGITNNVYNDMIQQLDEYVETLSIIDLLEVIDHKDIKKVNANLKPTQKAIDEAYDVILDTLEKSDDLKYNAVANAYRSSMVDPKQICQCVGPRGYVTEVDSTIFRQPILSGYTQGMRFLYESLIESRSASKALMFQKDPLAQCEYFNRQLQLVAGVVDTLVMGDCGSQHTMSWKVEPGELKVMEGLNYVDNGEVKTIQKDDYHLVGQVINLRTVFGCTHPDRQTVCETCYGEIAQSLPHGTNPGHVGAISLGEKTSQLVLSTKHVDGSSKVDAIDLGDVYSRYLVSGADENTLRLAPDLKGQSVSIVLPSESASSLPDIYNIDDFREVSVSLVTELTDVTFLIGDETDEEIGLHEMKVPVSMGSRLGSLTRKALLYIKTHGFTLSETGDYVVDLSKWDVGEALFELPLKHINMLDYQSQVKSFILSTNQAGDTRKYYLAGFEDKVEAIKELNSLVSSKLSINLSHILIIAYATAGVDPKNGNYHLPRGGEPFEFMKVKDLMQNRSLGALMAYEEQDKAFDNFESFTITDRPRHPIDPLLIG